MDICPISMKHANNVEKSLRMSWICQIILKEFMYMEKLLLFIDVRNVASGEQICKILGSTFLKQEAKSTGSEH